MTISNTKSGQRSGLSGSMGPGEIPAVEGSKQCVQCMRFMKLGEGRLCDVEEGGLKYFAEIVGEALGPCKRYLKAAGPFATGSINKH